MCAINVAVLRAFRRVSRSQRVRRASGEGRIVNCGKLRKIARNCHAELPRFYFLRLRYNLRNCTQLIRAPG